MLQKLFQIPGLNVDIYSYGLMLVIGFFLGAQLLKFLARRKGLDPEIFMNAALIALVSGIIGARVSHVLENFSQYHGHGVLTDLKNMLSINKGGLTYYGGFLLAFPTLVLYARWKRVPLGTGMDIVAPALLLAYGFGRIGCFLNGCCYGADCDLPWALRFPYGSPPYTEQYAEGTLQQTPPHELLIELPSNRQGLVNGDDAKRSVMLRQLAATQRSNAVHPTQLYSAITELLLAAMLFAYFTLRHAPGHVFALMCILEGITRFLLETLRVEPTVVWGMSLSMIIGVAVFAIGVVLWFIFTWVDRRRSGPVSAANGNTAPALSTR